MKSRSAKSLHFLVLAAACHLTKLANADEFLDPALQPAQAETYAPAEVTRFNFDVGTLNPVIAPEKSAMAEDGGTPEVNSDTNSAEPSSK